jgi:hypothetical protein
MYTFGMILVAISIPLCILGIGIVAREAYWVIEDAIWQWKNR